MEQVPQLTEQSLLPQLAASSLQQVESMQSLVEQAVVKEVDVVKADVDRSQLAARSDTEQVLAALQALRDTVSASQARGSWIHGNFLVIDLIIFLRFLQPHVLMPCCVGTLTMPSTQP